MIRTPRRRRGASAIEFALTLPLLMVIVSAVLDYGWYLSQVSNVMHAVRDGARFGVTVDQDDGPSTAAESHTQAALSAVGIDCSTLSCDIAAVVSTTGGLDSLTVTVEIAYEPLLGLVPTPATLRGDLTMALEDQS